MSDKHNATALLLKLTSSSNTANWIHFILLFPSSVTEIDDFKDVEDSGELLYLFVVLKAVAVV